MITRYTLSSTAWTAVSTAGQSGSLWYEEDNSINESVNGVYITHSSTTVENTTPFKRLQRNNVMSIVADDSLDVYYARLAAESSTAIIVVDVI